MYTIIAGTNRADSNTLRVAEEYQRFLKEEGVASEIFSMKEITSLHRDDAFIALENKYLLPAEKFVFIVPEYNGVFPGILKLMIDLTDIRNVWADKKVLLTGIATGRSGNLRGLDTLTNILNYIKLHVLPNKIPISNIENELDGNVFSNPQTVDTLKQQVKEFIQF